MVTTRSGRKVDNLCEKCLLAAIEALNIDRNDVVLREVCASNITMFGDVGDDLRRSVQEHWNNLRRCNIRSYKMALDRHGVPASATTLKLLKACRTLSPESQTSDGSKYTDGDETEDVSDEIIVDNNEDNDEEQKEEKKKEPSSQSTTTAEKGSLKPDIGKLADALKMMQVSGTPHHATPHIPPFLSATPHQATPQNQLFQSPFYGTNLFSSPRRATETSARMSEASTRNGSTIHPFGTSEIATFNPSNEAFPGSSTNPFIVNVDFDYPERAFPFEVVRVPRIQHNGWAREAVDIRTMVGVGDAPAWSAWMDADFPGRAIIVRGRSRSSAFEHLEQYHRNDDGMSDLKAVHDSIKKGIESDPARQALYWRIVMPDGFLLDNALFSSDSRNIMKNEVGIGYKVQDLVDCNAFFVSWQVARKGSGHTITVNKQKALMDAFA